jgi:predicted enzyme related to lactoylglutathione lyase
MTRVTGIGGIFFKAKDPGALGEWYRVHLGINVQEWGGTVFTWVQPGSTVWSIFPIDTEYFSPGSAPFMVNYRVEDLDAVLQALREEGCAVDDKTHESEFGKFGWVIDPEGNRIELWQPPAGQ